MSLVFYTIKYYDVMFERRFDLFALGFFESWLVLELNFKGCHVTLSEFKQMKARQCASKGFHNREGGGALKESA